MIEDDPDLQAELDEALLALEELIAESPEEALSMVDSLPEAVRNRVEFRLTTARALQAVDELEKARQMCEVIAAETTDLGLRADVHHLLGDLLEDLEQPDLANSHFEKALQLDQELFQTRGHLTEQELEQRLQALLPQALDLLPAAQRSKITSFTVQLFPTPADIQAGLDPRAFSAYEKSGTAGTLRIFSANLDAEYGDLDELGEFEQHVLVELREQLNEHTS